MNHFTFLSSVSVKWQNPFKLSEASDYLYVKLLRKSKKVGFKSSEDFYTNCAAAC